MDPSIVSYEKLAIIIIVGGCGAGLAFAFAVLICCHIFSKNTNHFSRYSSTQRAVVFERQTTSDDNNGDLFSCCYEESPSLHHDAGGGGNEKIETPTTGAPPVQEHQDEVQQQGEELSQEEDASGPSTSTQQVRFTVHSTQSRNASFPVSSKSSNGSASQKATEKSLDSPHKCSSSGIQLIHRQKSFDEPDSDPDEESIDKKKDEGSFECEDDKSPETIETMRKQYRELWQLRATFEAEEEEEGIAADLIKHEAQPKAAATEQRLEKNDSGYKSIERRDYSIDYKSESIYRHFTSTSTSTSENPKMPHQSIEEEQEIELQATYV